MEEGRGSATTSETEPRDNRRPRLVGSAACLVPLAMMACVFLVLRPQFTHEPSGRLLLTEWSFDLVAGLIYGAFGILVVLSILCFTRLRWRPYGAAVALVFVGSCGMHSVAGLLNLHRPWVSRAASVVGPDGASYREGGNGEGRAWLCRDVDRGRWRDVVEIVAEGDDEDLSSYSPRVIRPADDARDGVRFDASGRVYVVAGGGVVRVALDPHGAGRTPRNDWEDAYRSRAMPQEDVSPFALLDATATGSDADVHELVQALGGAQDHSKDWRIGDIAWVPSEASLLAAFDSRNPWIVATAKRFIEAGGPTLYPTATQRLPR
jgi:hypothetical protein